MKSTGNLRLTLSLLLGAFTVFLFSNYGNKKVHPDLNSLMVEAFLKQNNKGDFSLNEFKKYSFYFEKGVTLKGTAIIKDGLFSASDVAASAFLGSLGAVVDYNRGMKVYSEEGSARMTPKQWITDGGYSADVPEVPASLRHFYDPTRPAGDRYLTDITNAMIMGSLQKYVLSNPRIDGVAWALGKPGDHSTDVQDHQYTWERGKLWMQMALKETDENKREEYMAKAWRSLGETLHMIADHGCPPHVRNDAHPSPLWNNNSWFGNPDPYEELIDILRRDNASEFTGFANGAPDNGLKSGFAAMTRVEEIAHSLAVFTNANFVTTETISGIDRFGNSRRQVTHPDYPYGSPLLENLSYNENDYSYSSASGVKQCVDHYYFAKLIPRMCEPYVDMECVKSQARALFPNLVEAGKNVIKLYIPKISVELTSLDKDLLKGEIRHKTDDEYPTPIKYAGEVILTIKDKNNRVVDKKKVQAKDGKFEERGIKPAKEEKVTATIEFGGITVESSEMMGVSDNVFGVYEGKYSVVLNEANMLQAGLDGIQPDLNAEMRSIMEGVVRNQVKNDIAAFKWIIGGAQGGPVVKFEIGRTRSMENYYETAGLKYYVYNLSNTASIPKFLTPLKDGSNAGTTLQCLSNGFVVVCVKGNEIITIHGTFRGNELVGDYNTTHKGKVLWSATFSARKIVEM
jgi:hypothetical protein